MNKSVLIFTTAITTLCITSSSIANDTFTININLNGINNQTQNNDCTCAKNPKLKETITCTCSLASSDNQKSTNKDTKTAISKSTTKTNIQTTTSTPPTTEQPKTTFTQKLKTFFETYRPYVSAKWMKSTVHFKEKQDYRTSKQKLKKAGAFALGLKTPNNLRFEVEYSFRKKGTYREYYSEAFYMTQLNLTKSFKPSTKMWMFNAYYDFETTNSFKPYITAGIGRAKNKLDFQLDTTIVGAGTASAQRKYSDKSKAWNIGFGIAYEINDNFAIDVGYKHTKWGKIKAYSDNTHIEEKLKSDDFLIGLRYTY